MGQERSVKADGMKKEIPAMGLVKWGSGIFRQG